MKTRTTLLLILLSINLCLAQDYSVTPISDYIEKYSEAHHTIAEELEQDNGIPFTKKLTIYEGKMSSLKKQFKETRTREYELKSVKRAKRHSCIGTRTREVTNCDAVFINPPNDKMYTKEDWITIEGEKASVTVINKNTISLSLKATGKRTNKAVIYARYMYLPEEIPTLVNNDVTELFNQLPHR